MDKQYMLRLMNIIVSIALMWLSLGAVAAKNAQGCMYRGELMQAGEKVYIDDRNPKTKAWHKQFFDEHGVNPDGGAYKMAVCTVLVDVNLDDVADKADRQWVWVQDVEVLFKGRIARSYADLERAVKSSGSRSLKD